MKKAKTMLMSIAVLATVGSALAFKVAKKGETTYCYEITTIQPEHCLNILDDATMIPGSPAIIYYTTKGSASCDQLDCPFTAEYVGN